MTKIPTSLFSRGPKLLKMAAKIATEEVSSKIKRWEEESTRLKSKVKLAREVLKTLNELKGASMKVGQLLALDVGDYLPPEVIEILEELQQKSTYLPFPTIEGLLKEELKEKIGDFSFLSAEPMAAASIGQVHRAQLKGRDVVIKIQYPGISESIPSDIKMLEIIFKQLLLLQGKRQIDIAPLLKEIKETLLLESDYEFELSCHQKYEELFKAGPYIIPRSYSDYSTKKILTLDFIQGKSLTEWLKTTPPDAEKRRIAQLLIDLYLKEIFTHQLVQTDPNPGNFIITPTGEMALIDFGAVKEFSNSFVDNYREIINCAYHGDEKGLMEKSYELNFLDPRESDEVIKVYLEMMDFLVQPFREKKEFHFNDKTFVQKSRNYSWEFMSKCKYSPPPKDLIFLHRKLGGIFSLIKKMDVSLPLREMGAKYFPSWKD